MADILLTDLSENLTPSLDDIFYMVDDPTGTPGDKKVKLAAIAAAVGYPVQGRLTTETGVSVSTSDRTAQSTVYFTPYNGNVIALYTSSAWKLYTFTEKSIALSGLTSGKNYDVFIYDNSGTLTLELSAAWSSDTTRTDALTTQDGISVKSGATNKRHLGTIRTTGTTTTEDSLAKRFVWNRYNQVKRILKPATETTDSWTYTTAAFRQANANTANQLDYVTGDISSVIESKIIAIVDNNNAANVNIASGIGIDSTSVNSAQMYGTNTRGENGAIQSIAEYIGTPGLGRHFIAWLEYSAATSTTTWYGDAGNPTNFQSGMIGSIWN